VSGLWALLIGIDDYLPDRLPDGTRYPSLHGPVADVSCMALLLRDQAGLQPERTRMLLSRAGEDGQPIEPPERRPTYANMVAAFKQLAAEAQPGERVYVHYSGHGARRPTKYPEIKRGPGAQDEALVPCDIGDLGSRYLLDLELAALMQLLVDRGLIVTVVLDCCHAGGAMRTGWQAVPRGVPWIERAPVPSAVAEPAVLGEIWQALRQEERNVTVQSGLPVAHYALFAACRPDEFAYEYPFERGEPRGALTYWLLHTLERYGSELSCGEIHQRLVARIRGHFAVQTPMYLGPAKRGFLSGATRSLSRPSPMALRVGEDGLVLIDAGLASGMKSGTRVLTSKAELAIRRVGATESWAEVIRVLGPGEIEPGARAEIFPLRANIRLLPPEPGDRTAEGALDRLREALPKGGDGFIELCEEEVPDLCVAVAEDLYEIRDPGGDPFPNLRPLRVDDPNAVPEMIRRLDHLSKFRNILSVENPCPADWLGIGLELGTHDLRVEEKVRLRLVNRSNLRLDFAVLNLAPDYSITQLLPEKGSFTLLPLDPDEEHEVNLTGWLPQDYEEGKDILKVFATHGATSFRWLELPPLERPALMSYPRIGPRNPLEQLFARLAAVRPAHRGWLTPSEYPEEEWITAQVEIRVRR
jgi:hypothetical protein